MKNKIIYSLLFLILLSCSKDDDNQTCVDADSTMVINGELQTFQTLGYGIDLVSLNPISHELQINLYRSSTGSFNEQNIYFILPYKKTGKNKITEFHYSESSISQNFEGDFINGEFECNVKSNSRKCFYATVSGKLVIGNQTVEITDGIISVVYDEPFDE